LLNTNVLGLSQRGKQSKSNGVCKLSVERRRLAGARQPWGQEGETVAVDRTQVTSPDSLVRSSLTTEA